MKNVFLPIAILLLTLTNVVAQKDSPSIQLTKEGIELFDAGKYDEALKKYEEALKLDKDNGHALYEAGNTYMAQKDYKTGLKYAERIIDKGIEPVAEAYILKGNALDMMEKPEKAIAAYQEGIKRSKPNALLHFNLGIALLRGGKYEEAAPAFEEALSINPGHRSSHYCLGLSYAEQGLKVKTLLPLYYFLLLENKGQRAQNSCAAIQRTIKSSVEQTGEKSINININPNSLSDEFSATEMLMSFKLVGDQLSRQALEDSLHIKLPALTLGETLSGYNASLFGSLAETNNADNKPKSDFWMRTYGNFFVDMDKHGHTEAFTYYILSGECDPKASDWLKANKDKLMAFSDWVNEESKK